MTFSALWYLNCHCDVLSVADTGESKLNVAVNPAACFVWKIERR